MTHKTGDVEMITKSIKAEVEQKLAECIAIAERKFGRKFPMPSVTYQLRGTTAGTAQVSANHINLNAVLLLENGADFINRTVPHEFAHIVDYVLHPENFQRSAPVSRWSSARGKRSVHGPTWKAIMVAFGAEPSRCHSFDVASVRKKTTKYVWVCPTCGAEAELGPKRHAKMESGASRYWVPGCGNHARYVHKDTTAPAPKVAPKAAPKAVAKPAARVVPVGTLSKMDKCRALFDPNATRAENIRQFVLCGCTPAGAGTYYNTIKKERA